MISEGKPDAKEEFERLLSEEVKSTRTNWTEWRRTWKKDRRFWGWGRDDREREKKFKDWLTELGERECHLYSISLELFPRVQLIFQGNARLPRKLKETSSLF